MKVTLQSDDKHDRKHSFNVVVRDHELLLTTPEGKAIASLVVQTMERDVKGEDDKYHTEPTDNFWVCFRPSEFSGMKDAAEAWVVETRVARN